MDKSRGMFFSSPKTKNRHPLQSMFRHVSPVLIIIIFLPGRSLHEPLSILRSIGCHGVTGWAVEKIRDFRKNRSLNQCELQYEILSQHVFWGAEGEGTPVIGRQKSWQDPFGAFRYPQIKVKKHSSIWFHNDPHIVFLDQTCHVPGLSETSPSSSLGESEEIRIFGFHPAMAIEVRSPKAVALSKPWRFDLPTPTAPPK